MVDVRVYLRSSVGILDEALDLTADLCTALFLHLVLFPAIPIIELTQCYHLTTFISLLTGPTGPPNTFHFACLCCLGCLCFGFVFVVSCVVVVFAVFLNGL